MLAISEGCLNAPFKEMCQQIAFGDFTPYYGWTKKAGINHHSRSKGYMVSSQDSCNINHPLEILK